MSDFRIVKEYRHKFEDDKELREYILEDGVFWSFLIDYYEQKVYKLHKYEATQYELDDFPVKYTGLEDLDKTRYFVKDFKNNDIKSCIDEFIKIDKEDLPIRNINIEIEPNNGTIELDFKYKDGTNACLICRDIKFKDFHQNANIDIGKCNIDFDYSVYTNDENKTKLGIDQIIRKLVEVEDKLQNIKVARKYNYISK